jgi:hypothetical protein
MTLENLTIKARNNIGLPKLTITAETFACQSHAAGGESFIQRVVRLDSDRLWSEGSKY